MVEPSLKTKSAGNESSVFKIHGLLGSNRVCGPAEIVR